MKVFIRLIDAMVNRVTALVTSFGLRRISHEIALAEADTVATLESRIAEFKENGQTNAASRLDAHLSSLKGQDPSYDLSVSCGRQLLADDWSSVDTPEMRGDVVQHRGKKRGRPRKNDRLSGPSVDLDA